MPENSPGPRRTGRRPGQPDTRDEILTAARELFAQKGYAGATIRQIAGAAGVDPALVSHYFGAKESLFRAALDIPVRPQDVLQGIFTDGLEAVPRRLVSTILHVWEDPRTGPAMVSLLRTAVTQDAASPLLREYFSTNALHVLARQLRESYGLAEAELRVSLVASQMLGLTISRQLLRLEPLASMPASRLVEMVTPTISRYLLGDLDELPPPSSEHARPDLL